MFLKQWHDGRGSMKGLEKLLKAIFTYYLPNTKHYVENPPHMAMVKNIEDLELRLEYFGESASNCNPHMHYKEDII